MSIYVTYDTALRFWDLLRRPPHSDRRSRRMEILDLGKPIRADIDEFHDDCRRFFGTRSEEILAEPISISVGLEANRSYLSGVECHVWSGPLPTGAMQQISPNVFVATPEQCLLERTRASHETRIAGDLDIIRMGFRLCGTYSLASCDAGEDGVAVRQPLSSAESLKRFLSSADVRGSNRAASLLPYVLEKSASPRETALSMHLWLPHHLGCFCAGRPQLNYTVDIDEGLRLPGGPRSYRIDLCYPDARLAIEYDGEGHADPPRIARDAQRRNDLSHMGWRIITVTARQLRSREAMAQIARDVASAQGMRLRIRARSFEAHRQEFCRVMLPRAKG